MLASVCLQLSRLMWRSSISPLRAAVMARRLCLKLKDTCGPANQEELQVAADEFEDWAVRRRFVMIRHDSS